MTKLAEQLKQGAGQAWESLSEGWRELSARASGLLRASGRQAPPHPRPASPRRRRARCRGWRAGPSSRPTCSMTPTRLVVRLEACGMRREDFHVGSKGDIRTVWGEKHIDREATQGRWHVVQCAYGGFRRDVILPVSVKAGQTQARYRMRIELPKSDAARVRRIPVQTA